MTEPALRIAHCTWIGDVGGAERALHLLVREQLRDPETTPAVLFARGGFYAEKAREVGCEIAVLDARGGLDLRTLPKAVRFLRGHDVHHFHGAEPLFMIASLLCRGPRRVYTQRAGAVDAPALPFVKRQRYRMVAAMMRRFDAYSANTCHAIGAAESFFDIPPDRVRVTYNGLQFELLEPRRPASEVELELGLEADDFVLGTAAVLKDWKRIDRLVTATAAVAAAAPRLKLLVVGDGPERPRLEALAADLGIESRVVFAGVQTHVGDYLQVMDAFALPSDDRESFGNAVVEAMAVGLPSIVFRDSGGMREHVRHGETGLVVAGGQELGDAVLSLYEDPSSAARIGQAGRDFVRSTYTPEKAAERYKRLYREAMAA